nr:hypothetical protein [uncultured Methanoregula sp.]
MEIRLFRVLAGFCTGKILPGFFRNSFPEISKNFLVFLQHLSGIFLSEFSPLPENFSKFFQNFFVKDFRKCLSSIIHGTMRCHTRKTPRRVLRYALTCPKDVGITGVAQRGPDEAAERLPAK